jgi:Arc/MetJ-type ribon-helix-helix transcriptional regulator
MTTVQTQIPDQLLEQAQYMVQQGWVANIDELIAESMLRYLESHLETTVEHFVREDVQWGLYGNGCI